MTGFCGTCQRYRPMPDIRGFGSCPLKPVWRLINQSRPCQFTPSRYISNKTGTPAIELSKGKAYDKGPK